MHPNPTDLTTPLHLPGRHARASQVTINISATQNDIHITVRDNGQGAAAAAFEAAGAYCVMGMRERARHWGGKLEISSKNGLGCTFHLHIQLQTS